MDTSEIVLGLVGSPNRAELTNQLKLAALERASRAGIATELVQMADHVVAACKDHLPWVCLTKQKCTFEDHAFMFLSQKVLNCGAQEFRFIFHLSFGDFLEPSVIKQMPRFCLGIII